MGKLDGKTAIVTGASRGIGRGIAEGFAQEGAKVAVNHLALQKPPAREVKESIEKTDGDAIVVEGDVTEITSVHSMVETVEEAFGSIDILVNNAGVIELASIQELTLDIWEETMAVNLRGVFLVTQSVVPNMLEKGGGKIINIASQRGIIGGKNRSHYAASKGGVILFTRSLAQELAPEINVNAIAPGPINTDFVDLTDEERKRIEQQLPMGRLGEVEDVVPSAIFLASEDSSYFAGQTLSPDGGHAMH